MTDNFTAALRRFADGTDTYIFPPTVTRWSDNFAELMTHSDRLPGLPGGFDQYGLSASPSDVGLVELTLWLIVNNPALMTAAKDGLNRIAALGKRKLWMQPYDLGKRERWCNARVKRIDMPEDAEKCTDVQQEVKITFEVPEARWYALPTGAQDKVWDGETSIWGDSGTIWGGGAGSAFTGPGPTDYIVTSEGSAPSAPIIKLTCSASQIIVNPVIERVVSGTVVEHVRFTGTIGNSQVLLIDAQRMQALLDSTDVYDAMTVQNSTWLSVVPGSNTFRVRSNSGTDAGTFKVVFNEAYF